MKLLIRGCAHSGTNYTSVFLNKIGLRVGHETVTQDGIITWLFDNNCRYINGEGYVYLHQTRRPLKTIDTCLDFSKDTWIHVKQHINIPLHESQLYKCMYYYYYWNKLVERHTLFQYTVEDIDDLLDILDLFKINYDKEKIDEAKSLPKNIAHIPRENPHKLTYQDLVNEDRRLTYKIQNMEKRYYR